MFKLFLVLFLFIFFSCKKQERAIVQEDFVFSYGGYQNLEVLKFVGDTVFLPKYYPYNNKVYFFTIDKYEVIKINSYLDSINKISFKKEYVNEFVVDGFEFQLELLKSKKRVYVRNVHSYELEYLHSFAEFLEYIYSKKQVTEYKNLDIDFGNLEKILPPPEPDFNEIFESDVK